MNTIKVIRNKATKTISINVESSYNIELSRFLRSRGYDFNPHRKRYYKCYATRDYIKEYLQPDLKTIFRMCGKYKLNEYILVNSMDKV